MRFRYELQDGKHLVKTRDDTGEWLETRSYASEEDAQAIVARGEQMAADTIAEVEKALTGPKGTAHHGVAPKPKALPTKTEGATENVPDIDKDDPPPEPTDKHSETTAGKIGDRAPARPVAKEPKEDWSDLDPHDFTVIPGIGAATSDRLREGGIKTLRMLSRVSASKAEELGIREEWIAEAKRLSE